MANKTLGADLSEIIFNCIKFYQSELIHFNRVYNVKILIIMALKILYKYII